jgi:hypothetical protein
VLWRSSITLSFRLRHERHAMFEALSSSLHPLKQTTHMLHCS